MARKKQGVLVTAAMLRRAGACRVFCKKFRAKYPSGVRVTKELCEKNANSRLMRDHWNWARTHLLSTAGIEKISAIDASITGFTHKSSIWHTNYIVGQRTRRAVIASAFGYLFERDEFRAF